MKLFAGLLPCLSPGRLEAGCDEAGRGCLAGPVFAAAVILPADFHCDYLNDSKQMSENQRDELRPVIEENALSFALGVCTPGEIDKMNILWASVKAMHRALSRLTLPPEHILVDGNRFSPYMNTPYTCVIKGDSKYLSIAAASVLAKTYRDEYMRQLHEEYPFYGWDRNKGYPTKAHRAAIRKYGITGHHRKSFNLFDRQLEINW
ncbi:MULTISPECIES: ribonuclease HII [Proteiniphilum]|jgi:ribonuclease HII|uniref:ribonuclease HII n=1 Tax=Proteiniphilum TaxID=294702 RepID=UPI001EEBEA8D|nr:MULTISPECIES: ribonuclease HII [Proteiniphilum]ULB35613.1 ribonuclease HII [Proteiniphilum propionicum]